MRVVSPALAEAIESGDRRVSVRVGVDWDVDGITYGPGEIDDVTPFVAGVSVERSLVGSVPEEVRVVEGSATASASVDLAGGDTVDDRKSAAWRFSRLNSSSPLAGKERFQRPVEISAEYATSEGLQRVQILDGRSRDLDVDASSGTASLEVLDRRELLRATVELPAIAADVPDTGIVGDPVIKPGLEATWVAARVLYENGLYVAPPARPGCRYYAPMAGSAFPFIGGGGVPTPRIWQQEASVQEAALFVDGDPVRCEFEPGPYLLGTKLIANGGTSISAPLTTDGPPMHVGARADGRLECWARAPGPFPVGGGAAIGFHVQADDPETGDSVSVLSCMIGVTSTTARMMLLNGITGATIATGPIVNASDEWRAFGWHWDLTNSTVYFRVNGVTTTAASTTGPVWPANEFNVVLGCLVLVSSAYAEVHVTGGLSPSEPWLDEVVFEPTARIDRSTQRLDGIVPTGRVDSWDLLQELAAAELATVSINADGLVEFRTTDRLASTEAQTVQATLTTEESILALGYSDSIDQLRNVVSVQASPVVIRQSEEMYAHDGIVRLPPRGSTSLTIPIGQAIILVRDVVAEVHTTSLGGGTNHRNDVVISAQLVGMDTVILTFANRSTTQLWVCDTDGNPALSIVGDWIEAGTGAATTIRNQASIDAYGEQPLDVPANPWRQRDVDAGALAARLATDLAWPSPVLTGFTIVGDPRLELDDRVRVRDRDQLVLDGDYWLTSIRDELSPGEHTQQLVARRAKTVMAWDGPGAWDDPNSMWGA